MPGIRKIRRHPPKDSKNYFVVDACFLANKYIPLACAPDPVEQDRIRQCQAWWTEISNQVKARLARVYVPDVCVAETFKVLAKKYYVDKWFQHSAQHKTARDRCSRDLTLTIRQVKARNRIIRYHNIPTTRDLIIAVDRFYELFMKHKKKVQIADLMIVATAKYLMDFFDLPRRQLHIVTLDRDLWSGSKKIAELPNAYDPTQANDAFDRVFVQRK